jgi:hypothetical protein
VQTFDFRQRAIYLLFQAGIARNHLSLHFVELAAHLEQGPVFPVVAEMPVHSEVYNTSHPELRHNRQYHMSLKRSSKRSIC